MQQGRICYRVAQQRHISYSVTQQIRLSYRAGCSRGLVARARRRSCGGQGWSRRTALHSGSRLLPPDGPNSTFARQNGTSALGPPLKAYLPRIPIGGTPLLAGQEEICPCSTHPSNSPPRPRQSEVLSRQGLSILRRLIQDTKSRSARSGRQGGAGRGTGPRLRVDTEGGRYEEEESCHYHVTWQQQQQDGAGNINFAKRYFGD